MKKKIVLWGNDGEDKKILIGIELKAEENIQRRHSDRRIL